MFFNLHTFLPCFRTFLLQTSQTSSVVGRQASHDIMYVYALWRGTYPHHYFISGERVVSSWVERSSRDIGKFLWRHKPTDDKTGQFTELFILAYIFFMISSYWKFMVQLNRSKFFYINLVTVIWISGTLDFCQRLNLLKDIIGEMVHCT